jgi:hypothetical protein
MIDRPSATESPPARETWIAGYLLAARQPLNAAAFVLAMLLIFEAGRRSLGSAGAPRLVAERLIDALSSMLGPLGELAPALPVAVGLLTWVYIDRTALRPRVEVLAAMVVESVLLATPLLVMFRLFGVTDGARPWLYALGAGVYEEFFFRWLLVGGGLLALRQFSMPATLRVGLAIGLAAIAFAGSHVAPVGGEPWSTPLFGLRLAAGVYLGLLYVGRGIGIATGAHAAFNVIAAQQ